jgi:uncharacterized glyoxalase superfamily protein PhnB
MNTKAQPVPEGFRTVTPYLIVQDIPRLLDFLKGAFNAEEMHRSTQPDGTVNHATVRIGDSMVMMGEARPEWPPMPTGIYLYVEDADVVYQKALQAGAESVMAPRDEFYGDRMGGVRDGSGNYWWIATHIEDVTAEEMARREKERSGGLT